MTRNPDIVIENRFEASPEYALAWLTDFRADDGRFFGDEGNVQVERRGNEISRSLTTPFGPMRQTIRVDPAARRWEGRGEQLDPSGRVLYRFHLAELTEPDARGSRHRVELTIEPEDAQIRGMLPQLLQGWQTTLREGFARIAEEMAASAKAGKPPTA